jgi:hypothetical protein
MIIVSLLFENVFKALEPLSSGLVHIIIFTVDELLGFKLLYV